ATSYGTYTNITRGDFANLLYNTISFVMESLYYPEVASAEVSSTTALKLKLSEAVPSDFEAQDVADAFYYTVKFADGKELEFTPTAASLSNDRLTATLNLGNLDLTGKKGQIIIDDLENELAVPFDFSVPAEKPVEAPVPAAVPAE